MRDQDISHGLDSSGVVDEGFVLPLFDVETSEQCIQDNSHFVSMLLTIQSMLLDCFQQFNQIALDGITIFVSFNFALHASCTMTPEKSVGLCHIHLALGLSLHAHIEFCFEDHVALTGLCCLLIGICCLADAQPWLMLLHVIGFQLCEGYPDVFSTMELSFDVIDQALGHCFIIQGLFCRAKEMHAIIHSLLSSLVVESASMASIR